MVDCRILQRLDYPEYIITVDRAKASVLKLTQLEVMENLVAAEHGGLAGIKYFTVPPGQLGAGPVGPDQQPHPGQQRLRVTLQGEIR